MLLSLFAQMCCYKLRCKMDWHLGCVVLVTWNLFGDQECHDKMSIHLKNSKWVSSVWMNTYSTMATHIDIGSLLLEFDSTKINEINIQGVYVIEYPFNYSSQLANSKPHHLLTRFKYCSLMLSAHKWKIRYTRETTLLANYFAFHSVFESSCDFV